MKELKFCSKCQTRVTSGKKECCSYCGTKLLIFDTHNYDQIVMLFQEFMMADDEYYITVLAGNYPYFFISAIQKEEALERHLEESNND